MNVNDLHRAACHGDKAAHRSLFTLLSERFALLIHRKVWNEQDARDIVQDALVTIAGEYDKIEFRTSFQAWAYKVLENKLLGYFKKKRSLSARETAVPDAEVAQHLAAISNPAVRVRLLDCLRKINAVNTRHARVLNLKHQGYSTEEICERVRIGKNAFYIVLHRARAALEICLDTGEIKK